MKALASGLWGLHCNPVAVENTHLRITLVCTHQPCKKGGDLIDPAAVKKEIKVIDRFLPAVSNVQVFNVHIWTVYDDDVIKSRRSGDGIREHAHLRVVI